jgi:hypothetical protein
MQNFLCCSVLQAAARALSGAFCRGSSHTVAYAALPIFMHKEDCQEGYFFIIKCKFCKKILFTPHIFFGIPQRVYSKTLGYAAFFAVITIIV